MKHTKEMNNRSSFDNICNILDLFIHIVILEKKIFYSKK